MKILLIFIIFTIQLKAEWVEIFNKVGYNFISIDCIDSNNCYFLINPTSVNDNLETLVYKSNNKGITMKEMYNYNPFVDEPIDLYDPWCASVPNGKDYFISYFNRGHIKVSNDSAKTFRTLDFDTPREVLWIEMYNNKIGMAFTPINNFITFDGWKSWEKREDFFKIDPNADTIFAPSSPKFINKDTLCLMTFKGRRSSFFTIHDLNTKESLFYIIDTTDFERVMSITDFCYIDSNTIIGVGSMFANLGDTFYNLIYKSTDGGKTWEKKHQQLENINSKVSYAFGLQKVDFYDNKNGVAVGQAGSVALTNDGGETWVYDEIPESMDGSATMKVEWAGKTPIIGTYVGGLYIYEGDYFKFDPEEQYKITGHVTTEKGDPVEGAEIIYRLPSKPSQTYSVLTDNTGNYVIDDMPNETCLRLNPAHTYFLTRYSPNSVNYCLTKDTVINFVQITAEEFYDISGKVSEEGEGVKRIPVELQTSFGSKKTFTDDFGNYRFEEVPEGNVSVINGSASIGEFWYYQPFNHEFNLTNDTTEINFEIVERDKDLCRRVSGRVTLEGEGVADVEVALLVDSPLQFDNVFTDEDGYYITNFLCGNWMEVMLYDIEYEKYSVTPDMYNLYYHEYPDGYVNIDFELSPITSVENIELTPQIYPNPANESITISGIWQGKIEIYNTLGQKLIEKEIFGTRTINTNILQTGMYVIKIESGGEVVFEKVIINR